MANNIRTALEDATNKNPQARAQLKANGLVPPGMALGDPPNGRGIPFSSNPAPPQAPSWTTSPGATPEPVRAPGTSLVVADRQPTTRVPFNSSAGVTPPATPNLPATIEGQGLRFVGNGANQNFTTPGASSPYDAQGRRFDATAQQMKSAAADRAADRAAAATKTAQSGAATSAGPAAGKPGMMSKAFGSAEEWSKTRDALTKSRSIPGSGMLGTLGKVAAPAGAIMGGVDAYQGMRDGDYTKAGFGAADAAASAALLSPAAPAAGAYLASRAVYNAPGMIRSALGESGLDKLGGVINQIGLSSGMWGVDDSELLAQRAGAVASSTGAASAPVRQGAAGAPALPFGGTNPDQRVARDQPGASGESLRGQFGDFSPAGAFNNGYTDMGGGIAGKGSGARGQPNDFTNIGANGQPTAMSGMDSRTPGQIADGERIKAETAATLTNPDGSKWSARDNAMMAANLRDGVNPYRNTPRGQSGPQVLPPTSRDPSASSGSGSVASQVAELKRAGIKVSAPTLRQIMSGETSRATTSMNNEASARTTGMNNETSLRTNAATNETSRSNNADTNATQRGVAALPQRLQLQAAQMQRETRSQIWEKAGGDPQEAARLSAQLGLDPKEYTEMAKSNQEYAQKASDNTREQLGGLFFTKDDKGNRVPDKEAAGGAYAYLNRVTKGKYESLLDGERNALLADAVTRHSLVQGANARLRTGPLQKMGITNSPSPYGDLPTDAQMQGGTVSRAGVGIDTVFGDPSPKDWRLKTKDGGEMFFPEGTSEDRLKYLTSRGVTLR